MLKIKYKYVANGIILALFCASPFSYPTKCHANLIEQLMETKQSIVSIRALQFVQAVNPKASAAIDPKNNRVLVARNVRRLMAEQKGAGIIISHDGLIVTNLHTIRNAQKILVALYNNQKYSASLLHLMLKHDLALIKISPKNPLTPIAFADSNLVRLGDPVANIGHSDLMKGTLSGGRVTALGTSRITPQQPKASVEVIKVNIDLHKGDSGGPLLNEYGELIGMIIAQLKSKTEATFAIPSNKIKKLYLDYIRSIK